MRVARVRLSPRASAGYSAPISSQSSSLSTLSTNNAAAASTNRGTNRPTLESLGFAKPGDKLSGFTVTRPVLEVKEFDLRVVQAQHDRTKAWLIHVDTSDTNNAFAVAFRTPPDDSAGLPHILEHVALCGSKKYPVRDPFFKMLKRSLNTDMNAMTASDYTYYPFATANARDYLNLLDVYLDATFYPLLRETDFRQEGHRLELDPENNTLIRSGVVYNEMKGALGDSSSLFSTRLSQALFAADDAQSPYAHVSGGDPLAIPTLTHENLKAKHALWYHPSNAVFSTYGDLPVTETLKKIDENVLRHFEPNERSAQVKTRLAQPPSAKAAYTTKDIVVALPPDDETTKLTIARAWTLPEIASTNAIDVSVGNIASDMLLNGPQAPVFAALIDAGVAPEYSPGVGFDPSTSTVCLSLGANGLETEEGVRAAEEAIERALVQAAEEGFAKERLESKFHLMELQLRNKRANFGMGVISSVASTWTHGGDVFDSLAVNKLLKELRRVGLDSPDAGEFWKRIVRDWFLKGWRNPKVRVLGRTESTFVADATAKEKALLLETFKGLDSKSLEEIQAKNALLERERAAPEDLSVLPTLRIAQDVPAVKSDVVHVRPSLVDERIEVVQDQVTNGVVYTRHFVDTTSIKEKRLIPILCSVLGQLDVRACDFKSLSLKMDSTMGGLSISPSSHFYYDVSKREASENYAVFRKEGIYVAHQALLDNAGKAHDLLGQILFESRFAVAERDGSRKLSQLLTSHAQSLTSSISSSGLGMARLLAHAPHHEKYATQERMSGFSNYEVVKRLAANATPASMDELAEALTRCARALRESSGRSVRSSVVVSPSDLSANSSLIENSIRDKIYNASSALEGEAAVDARKLGDLLGETPAPVSRATYLALPGVGIHNCCATIDTGVGYGHPDEPALHVLSVLLQHDYLHHRIREKGGAYGAGSRVDTNGVFSMHSFWDPNSLETLSAFEDGLAWLTTTKFQERNVDEALLNVFQSLDAPAAAGSKGLGHFLHGSRPESQALQRERYLALAGGQGLRELSRVANQYLGGDLKLTGHAEGYQASKVSVCIAGKQESSSDFIETKGWEMKVA